MHKTRLLPFTKKSCGRPGRKGGFQGNITLVLAIPTNLYKGVNFINRSFAKTVGMRKVLVILGFIAAAQTVSAQQIDSIFFNLYTDSLKKGFYNYISVDGKLSNGQWLPLDTSHIRLISNAGFFKGNDLYIDSSYTDETVKVKAILKTNPRVSIETEIYIRKRGFDEPLKSDQEILDEMQKSSKKKRGS